jgi:hypothetical protein
LVDPRHGFWLLDDDRLRVETFSAELNLRQLHELDLYRTIFEELAPIARYGSAARAITTKSWLTSQPKPPPIAPDFPSTDDLQVLQEIARHVLVGNHIPT